MRTIAVLICVSLALATAGEAEARKKKRRRKQARPPASRLLQSASSYSPTATAAPAPAAPVVEAEVPPPVVEHDHFLVAALLLQGDVRYSPAAIGLSAAYQLRLSDTWRLSAGADVGLRSHRTLVEPTVGFEAVIVSLGPVELQALAGVSVPLQFMADTISVAVAGRAELGVRWQALDWLSPQAGFQVVVGPLVTPENLRWEPYAAAQLVVGARFGL